MKGAFAVSVICIQFLCSYGLPKNQGVGVFAYQDSTGNRYGGTYGLRDGQLFNFDNDVTTFGPSPYTDFQDLDSFFPEYFRNLEFILRQVFAKNSENQKLALDAARQAFDDTSKKADLGYNYGFDRFPGAPSFGFPPPNFGMFQQDPFGFQDRSAFAGASVGPGYQHQTVNINPPNPNMPNVQMTQYSDAATPRSGNGFYSVSSSSYASSKNVNGKEESQRGGETVVNNNGKVTKYSVHS